MLPDRTERNVVGKLEVTVQFKKRLEGRSPADVTRAQENEGEAFRCGKPWNIDVSEAELCGLVVPIQ